MTKTQFTEALATTMGITKSEASKVIDAYATTATASLKANGEITLPGLVKLTLKDTPAQPECQKMNPFTKQMVTVAAKPASKKVKVKPIAALKKAVV